MSLDKALSFWQHDTANVDLTLQVLDGFARHGDFSEGLNWAADLTPDVSGVAQVSARIGNLALSAGAFERAISIFEPLVVAYPNEPGLAYNLASAFHALGRFDDALQATRGVKAFWKDCTAIYLLNARALHHLARFDEAIEMAQAFLQHFPRHNQGEGLLSLVQVDSGDYAAGQSTADQVLARDSAQFEAGLAKATACIVSSDVDAATSLVDALLERHPTNGRVQSLAGQLALYAGDHNTALVAFTTAVQDMPQHIGSWHLQGWTQILAEDLAAARASFEQALLIDRNFAESHGGLAVVDALTSRADQAQKSIRRARGLDPNNLSARYAESILLRDVGNAAGADDIISQLFDTPTGRAAAAGIPLLQAMRKTAERNR
ncbi:MAG: tetratricopeptide repeat protein [Pseudomonadota bacterium]